MSLVPYLRDFVNERLTAAAEEILGVFERTIVEYEEEIQRQRRLLDIVLKPELKLHRIEIPLQHVFKEEEDLTHQQVCVQERNSSLDQEDEWFTSEEGEQLVLKQETDAFMLTPTYEESDHSDHQTLNFSIDDSQSAVDEEPSSIISVKSSVVSEPNDDQQLLSHNSHEAESRDQDGGKNGDSGSTNAEPEQQKQHHKSNCYINNVFNPTMSTTQCNTQTFKCDMCGKAFKCKTYLQRHMIVHKCTKPHTCKICGKSFQFNSYLKVHMRVHTGERPYTCKTCGKGFRCSSDMKCHMRTHTGEKPYTCTTCGKDFRSSGEMRSHMRTHTGERPYICKTCGKGFRCNSDMRGHIRTHTGEKPYTCTTCGKDFRSSSNLKGHMKRHTGKKLYHCRKNVPVVTTHFF
ncbi:zinc finger protein 3-like [Anoplopoma fimbria]|uniref:zinc finger protein 3-like n=1 Tax=Anoplopoma fimbria TaxID=229290 RepID=UPI0023EC8BD3|nr:zinc finger protein 3-like [Anoplopoma fimbria]